MVQFECLRHWNPSVISILGDGKFSQLPLLALWGNKNWLPTMKVKKWEIFQNKRGLRGCKLSSLNAPGSENPLSHSNEGIVLVPRVDIYHVASRASTQSFPYEVRGRKELPWRNVVIIIINDYPISLPICRNLPKENLDRRKRNCQSPSQPNLPN